MNKYMFLYLGLCAVIGLWTPIRTKRAKLIFVLAVALVLYFTLFPTKL